MGCCENNPRCNTLNLDYIKPEGEALDRISSIRAEFTRLEILIKENCTNSRERSLALTNLENACMYTVKAVVLDWKFPKGE